MNSLELFNTIKRTVLTIEDELFQMDEKGIYFAPELYVAFSIGKDVFQNREYIFGTNSVKWLRETDLGNGGPSDIIFEVDRTNTVIELKLRDNIYAYKADIEKLKRLPENTCKFFCVLLDSFSENNDARLINLELEYQNQIKRIGHHAFPTWNDWYAKKIFCNINLYQISST